jgi:hypothetical protein
VKTLLSQNVDQVDVSTVTRNVVCHPERDFSQVLCTQVPLQAFLIANREVPLRAYSFLFGQFCSLVKLRFKIDIVYLGLLSSVRFRYANGQGSDARNHAYTLSH